MTTNKKEILEKEDTSTEELKKDDTSNELETVKVDKKDFEAMMARLERLEKTSNKGRLANYDAANNKEETETIIKLRSIDGKVIVKWGDMVNNKAEVDPVNRQVVELQTVKVFYSNGESEQMSLTIFDRRYSYIFTVLKSEIINRDKVKIKEFGDRIFELEDENGDVYTVGEKFVN